VTSNQPPSEPFSESPQDPFDEYQQRWLAYRATPWASLRYAVVAETLTRHLRPTSRVLDVGGGDGGDALPLAASGHDVTVLDTSRNMLALVDGVAVVHGSLDQIPEGTYDAVLCHLVLQYRRDTEADIARLARALAPDGLLSVLVPGPVGPVLRAAARQGPAAARAELAATHSRTETFDTDVRRISDAELATAMAASNLKVVAQYGVRCLQDLVLDDTRKASDPDFYNDLLALELEVCGLEPYNRLGVFTQVLARRL